ncbi:MAG: acetyl-CoA carboxylase biotin carboxyl carrier protein [Solirubrobacteraceae bacterium]|jgi:acetyl-CoA carboxylase biotin carboxyl carrier protein|nr:acetyl-CoA carboxylase biotin carboxyl carrier protein [Solirubrobacteraceae bacterium]
MEMNQDTLKALLDAFDSSDWDEMIVTVGDDHLHVSRDALPLQPGEVAAPHAGAGAAPPATPAAPEPEPEPAPEPPADTATGSPITAPSVGLFWRSPAPGSPPFVEVGDRVAEGDTVGIVEVMKLMNYVTATFAGLVTAIPVANGETVEFGQALVVVDPEG